MVAAAPEGSPQRRISNIQFKKNLPAMPRRAPEAGYYRSEMISLTVIEPKRQISVSLRDYISSRNPTSIMSRSLGAMTGPVNFFFASLMCACASGYRELV
jgi:hypothetical protein